mmetsp:Transcript_5716/g.17689  ORF Transcript_5716/g.17689 Transcript_5716/m.17689 type:complete len:90 (+) Transcript_5716:75-344(+)
MIHKTSLKLDSGESTLATGLLRTFPKRLLRRMKVSRRLPREDRRKRGSVLEALALEEEHERGTAVQARQSIRGRHLMPVSPGLTLANQL